MNSRIILGIGFAIVFLCIGIIVFFVLSEKAKQPSPGEKDSPKTVAPTGTQISNPPYNEEATDKLIDTVKSRPPQSQEDTLARERLLSLLNYGSGDLYTSELVKIKYIKEPNVFQVEIKTLEVEAAKTETTEFFKEQGLSEDGICKLPVMFYLSSGILQEYKNSGKTFTSIPDYCL